MKEQDIQRKITKYLEQIGAYTVKVISANKNGVPDIIALLNGKYIAIEVKTPQTKTRVSELQQYNIDKINENGGLAFVAWNLDMVKDKLDA